MNEALEKTGVAMEAVKVMLDALKALPGADQRSLATARTHFETAFLWAGCAAQGGGVLG